MALLLNTIAADRVALRTELVESHSRFSDPRIDGSRGYEGLGSQRGTRFREARYSSPESTSPLTSSARPRLSKRRQPSRALDQASTGSREPAPRFASARVQISRMRGSTSTPVLRSSAS